MNTFDFDGKIILVTGGTGSFGTAFIRYLLTNHKVKAIRVFSRDELKQYHLNRNLKDDRLRFLLGDVRDRDRVYRASQDVDVIVHAAALKQVPACEYNPFEAVQTNINGAMNVVDAAIDHNVERVLALSTDKAVNPVNLYGATKLCSDKIFIFGNSYAGTRRTRFACVRYGNVMGSRGSVLPLFLEQKAQGCLHITDPRMTRFWITLDQAVNFVARSIHHMRGGEIFVPRIPSLKVVDLAKAVAPDAKHKYIGIRPGEKLHETLIMKEEAPHTLRMENAYAVMPEWFPRKVDRNLKGERLPEGFSYSSDSNDHWLTPEETQNLILHFQKCQIKLN